MKYILYTIIVFFLAIVQTSFFTSLHFVFPYINLLYVLLFAYYIARKDNLSLYLLFIAGIFIDILTVSQIGLTSGDIFLSLLVYMLVHRLFPNGKFETIASITAASVAFSCISYITANFIQGYAIGGFFSVTPWALLNAFLILIITNMISFLKPAHKESKIRID